MFPRDYYSLFSLFEKFCQRVLVMEISLEQKYLKQPVVYLSDYSTFSEGLPFHDYFK